MRRVLQKGSTQREHSAQRGVSIVELSIVLPLIVLMLLGIVQWGIIFGAELTLRSAATSAARFAVLGDSSPSEADVESYASEAVRPMLDPANATPDYDSTGTINGLSVHRVSISYDMDLFFPLAVPGSTNGQIVLTAATVMR